MRQQILRFMLAEGVTFDELAEKSGISEIELMGIMSEGWFPTPEQLFSLAKALQVPVHYLIDKPKINTIHGCKELGNEFKISEEE